MTDIPSAALSVPARLGVTARYDDGQLTLELTPQPETLHHGFVRASVVSFLIDAVAGIFVDRDPDVWTLTSDMSVRMRPMPAPDRVNAVTTILRQGKRSVICAVECTTDDGAPFATGALGFVHVPRREHDAPKPIVELDQVSGMFRHIVPLSRPLREEAGIEVIDAHEGVVQIDVTPEVRNPAGTLQGAMVALVAEAAAEDLVSARFEAPAVVTDIDLRYLGQTQVGPVRTRSRLLGDGPDAPIEIELVDTSTDKITTLVYARAAIAP